MPTPSLRRRPWPRRLGLVMVVSLLAAAVGLPIFGSNFYVSLVLTIWIYGLLAMSMDLLAGYTGLISLGHAAFLGIGAYGVAYSLREGLTPEQGVLIAVGAVAVTAAVMGVVAVRVRDLTFCILTLALGQVVWGLSYRWISVSGGDNGLPVTARPEIGPFSIVDDRSYYYLVLAVFLVCAVLLRLVVFSSFGLSLQGIRDNENRMRSLGYNVALHKYLAFQISALFGGIAGILLAFFSLYVSPSMLNFTENMIVAQMVILGGLGTLWGPLLGAGVVVFFQTWVSIHVDRWATVLGVIFILAVLFGRTGLWGAGAALSRALSQKRLPRAKEPPVGGDISSDDRPAAG